MTRFLGLVLVATVACGGTPPARSAPPPPAPVPAAGDAPDDGPPRAATVLELIDAERADAAARVIAELASGSVARETRADGSPALDLERLRRFGRTLRKDKDLYARYLHALKDGVGGAALVAELRELPPDVDDAFYFQKRIFDLVDQLNDPGAADELVRFLGTKPHPYLETRAALALSAVADLRAAPYLATRLLRDPFTTYGERDFELLLKRSDDERVAAARRLADLAFLYPGERAGLSKLAEDPLIHWLHERPSPHANGLRALAALGSTKDLAAFRSWSNPTVPLPPRGAAPPLPAEWVIAQSALRYVGALRDEPSWKVLLGALTRRPRQLDVTMDSILANGLALVGMSLRAIGMGAADGLAEWRDARAFAPLLAYVEDRRNNEMSRLSACSALGWVGSNVELQGLARRVAVPKPDDAHGKLLAACFLSALRERVVPGVDVLLLPLFSTAMSDELRFDVARTIGNGAMLVSVEASLEKLLAEPDRAEHAALALMLGGSPAAAARAVKRLNGATERLHGEWHRSLGDVTQEDVANGRLFRRVENAEAVAALTLGGRPQSWARLLLAKQLHLLAFDNGPHSATRVVLDHQLMTVARGTDDRLARLAIRTLATLGNDGMLLALSREPGQRAALAREKHDLLVQPAEEVSAP